MIYLPSHSGRAKPVPQIESHSFKALWRASFPTDLESESSTIRKLPQMLAT
ncbi:unnamed protein product [Ciceribacter selenitireducens ATCC BAA-1503]|uniref:Uncharacterized protein n=1 Tax=Ciceribacter selenitireducens ATCC BAA-1503 TaxID=1336235 RepID=A0A376AC06_9HYPH|nr:unnamed protein product [Ciceribacter selenitireducens ATCC BAA-1503]